MTVNKYYDRYWATQHELDDLVRLFADIQKQLAQVTKERDALLQILADKA